MANSVGHGALPYPIKNARFSLIVPYLDSTGTPTDPTTPDTEFSLDAGAFADCAEEVTTITGSNGMGYITLTGAETNGSILALAFKVASGPKPTLATLSPRNLPILSSGTLSAGSAGGGTLGTILPYNIAGCFIRTTGGTGGGGTGGANNQARRIITYTVATGAFTVSPNWETTPDATTTYDVLLPDGVVGSTLILPAALVNGRIDASVGAVAANVVNDAAVDPDMDTYQAKVDLIKNASTTNRYIIIWFKNGQPITSGITVPTIQVVKSSDGTDLVASSTPTQIGTTGVYKWDETGGLVTAGSSYFAKVTATIDGSTRTWEQIIGRDA